MEEAPQDLPRFRALAGLVWNSRLPYENMILRFRHILDNRLLAAVNDLLREKWLLLKTGALVKYCINLLAASSNV